MVELAGIVSSEWRYYIGSGRTWLAATASDLKSSNIGSLGLAPGKVFSESRWADLNYFVDVTPAVRLGAEYEYFWQHYEDGTEPTNHRLQLVALYIF